MLRLCRDCGDPDSRGSGIRIAAIRRFAPDIPLLRDEGRCHRSILRSLLVYVLLVLLSGLVMGRRIFAGLAFAPHGQVWSYGYVTMQIILGPSVLDSGDAAGTRFFDRIVMFLAATVYSVVAVWFFDGLKRRRRESLAHWKLEREPNV